MLHYVNLATARPRAVAQHPEGWPCAASLGQFHSGLDATVGKVFVVLCGNACAGVGTAVVVLFAGFDHELAIFEAYVFGSVGVILFFVVAPAPRASANLEVPDLGVKLFLVELVGPHQGIALDQDGTFGHGARG